MANIDRKVSGQRGKGRRIQPYAWLGAGAVTLGLGAAMASGTAIAHADDNSDAGNNGVSHSQSSNSAHASRAATHSTSSSAAAGSAARKSSASGTAQAAPAATAVSSAGGKSTTSHKTAVRSAAATVDTQPAAPDTSAVASSASTPPVNQSDPWAPGTAVPGAHVQLAFDGIKAAKTALNQNTWGQTNILGGLAAIAPNLLLSAASVELSAWQTLNPVAQSLVAATAGIPIVHLVARVSLYGTMLLPELSQLSLKSAALLMPVVGLFAPSAEAAASPLIKQATSDGRVYAVVRLKTYNTTEPIINAKVNGSSNQALLLDTGSSGLVIDQANAGTLDPNNKMNTLPQNGSYSGGFDYTYDTYKNTTVDFGNGVVSDPTYVNVVTSGTYNGDPSTLAAFLTNAGAVGILGVGANAYGPGPNPVPTSSLTLPGELSDGMLIYKNLLPLGLGGFVVFGPNPLPEKARLQGTPTALLNVVVAGVNNGNPQQVSAIIDSGGVYGTLPQNLVPGNGSTVPAGTKITVYAPDGTKLYSYTTKGGDYAPAVVGDSSVDYMNTGYYAYEQGPVYIDYSGNGGYGWTVFDIG